jgi:hypothetical protein
VSKLQKKPSALKREHPALPQEISKDFSTFVGHFALLDPDPEYGSGSTDLIESGYNPDPDPKPWL